MVALILANHEIRLYVVARVAIYVMYNMTRIEASTKSRLDD